MFGNGPESLPEVREWSGYHPGCPEVVRSHYRKSGRGLKAFPDVREWFRLSPGSPGVVMKPSQMSGSS